MNTIDQLLSQIAQRTLDIETLETRHGDSLDFHELAVWRLREALEAAFNAGVEKGRKTAKAHKTTGRSEAA